MSNYSEAVLQLIQKTPGLRAAQISDRLDIDLEIVQNIISKAVSDNQIEAQEVIGPNTLPTNTYSWIGVLPLGWAAPLAGAAGAAAAVNTDAVTSQPQGATEPRRSKAAVAIEYLAERGPTTRKDLAKVMGLPNASQVMQYMRPHLQSGKVACIDGIYCVADNPGAAFTGTSATTTVANDQAESVKTPPRFSGGIELVDILRARLTPDELRGYFKGNVIRCLLDAEHGGSAQDYRMGSVYANWLAETIEAQAA